MNTTMGSVTQAERAAIWMTETNELFDQFPDLEEAVLQEDVGDESERILALMDRQGALIATVVWTAP